MKKQLFALVLSASTFSGIFAQYDSYSRSSYRDRQTVEERAANGAGFKVGGVTVFSALAAGVLAKCQGKNGAALLTEMGRGALAGAAAGAIGEIAVPQTDLGKKVVKPALWLVGTPLFYNVIGGSLSFKSN